MNVIFESVLTFFFGNIQNHFGNCIDIVGLVRDFFVGVIDKKLSAFISAIKVSAPAFGWRVSNKIIFTLAS